MACPRSRITRYVGLFLCVLIAILIGRSAARHVYVSSRDSRGWTRLHIAASIGDLSSVEALIEKGADVFATTLKEGYTPLHLAAMQGHTPVVIFLTSEPVLRRALGRPARARSGHLKEIPREFGFSVTPRDAQSAHLQDNLGRTPLHYAVINNHKPVCEALLSNRLLVLWQMGEVNDRDHRTPIAYAVLSGDMDMVRFLTGKGSRVDDTLVRDAVIHASPEMLELLFALGGSPSPRFLGAQLPLLHEAVITGNAGMVAVLLRHKAGVNETDATGRSPLRLAAARGDTPIVRILLDHAASPDSADHAAITPLYAAVVMRRNATTALLMSRGASVRVKDGRGWSLLHVVAKDGNADLCHELIARGADVDATMHGGSTPLHLAAMNNDKAVADILISHGADPDAKDYMGQTPLHHAASCGSLEVARLLIARRANVHSRDRNGQSAADLADSAGEKEVLGLLRSVGARPGEGRIGVIEFRPLQRSPDLNPWKAGLRPLHGRWVSGARWETERVTPLRIAVINGDIDTVKALLEWSPDRPSVDTEDLEAAIRDAGRIGRLDIFEMLAVALAHRRELEALQR